MKIFFLKFWVICHRVNCLTAFDLHQQINSKWSRNTWGMSIYILFYLWNDFGCFLTTQIFWHCHKMHSFNGTTVKFKGKIISRSRIRDDKNVEIYDRRDTDIYCITSMHSQSSIQSPRHIMEFHAMQELQTAHVNFRKICF